MRQSLLAATALFAAIPAFAQESRIAALERQLSEQQARIHQLETLIAEQGALLNQMRTTPVAVAPGPIVSPPVPTVVMASAPTSVQTGAFHIPGLDVGGDLRVRREFNFSDVDARDRARNVLRARIRATYAVAPGLTIGAQIATGDPDDPNSTDVTLGNFVDDLDMSLDQAWVRYTRGDFTALAGKFPQLFQRTDMVWDGDVVPQGFGAIYATGLGGDARLDARAMYVVIDEAAAARDSRMIGGQIVTAAPLSPSIRLMLAGGYYHYDLHSVGGADAGDFRTNLIAGGRYLSDFRLINAIASLTWSGASPRWPIAFTADVVKNAGAAVSADTGFNLELSAGRVAQKGDWRVIYNYARVGVDAVFAAFSHDNLAIATNYQLHGVGVAFVPMHDVVLDMVFYHYRPLDAAYAGTNQPHDWLDLIRLNLLVNF